MLNIVSYTTSANFALRLTINGEFYGYIENEQVFLNAETSVLQRLNYFGSGQTVELIPEFSIANIGSAFSGNTVETLTSDQVANRILIRSDFKLTEAHGFFIDGNLHGAVRSEDLPLIRETIESLLNAHRSNQRFNFAEEEVSFLNHVVWEGYDLFLEESVTDPEQIIKLITSTRNGQPYLPVLVTRVEEYNVEVEYDTIEHLDDNLTVGSSSVVQQGVRGTNRVVAEVSYLNDNEIRRNITNTFVITEPTTRIINRGSRQPSHGVFETHAQYGMFVWPVVNSAGQPAGTRSRGISSYHSGLDIGAPVGTLIIAGDDGEVILSRYNYWSYGHTVKIRHADGKVTLYAHASALIVREGEWVQRGQHIANVGSTGRSTGPHLHFEIWHNGVPVNPEDFVSFK
jgi:hypothetical protein